MAKKQPDLKKSQKGKDGLIELLFLRRVSINITRFLVKTSITPNQVTFLSLVSALIASFFFYLANYQSLIIGAVFAQIALLLDFVDGEIARYKGLLSKFGAWFDAVTDRIKYIALLLTLSIGLYLKTANPLALILGMFAISNILMINLVRITTRYYIGAVHHAIPIKKTYLTEVTTLSYIIIIGALLNQVVYILLIFATFPLLVWLKQIYDVFRKEKHK